MVLNHIDCCSGFKHRPPMSYITPLSYCDSSFKILLLPMWACGELLGSEGKYWGASALWRHWLGGHVTTVCNGRVYWQAQVSWHQEGVICWELNRSSSLKHALAPLYWPGVLVPIPLTSKSGRETQTPTGDGGVRPAAAAAAGSSGQIQVRNLPVKMVFLVFEV